MTDKNFNEWIETPDGELCVSEAMENMRLIGLSSPLLEGMIKSSFVRVYYSGVEEGLARGEAEMIKRVKPETEH
jgi:hypothetical protein